MSESTELGTTAPGALAGLFVLECGDEGTQMCGKILADMGADVIKVEPPGGAASRHRGPYRGETPDVNESLYFWAYNTNKDSITLDLRSADGQAQLLGLAERADVLLEDYPPSYLSGLGLGYDDLSARNSGIVVTSVTPFGQDGPYSGWQGSDIVYWAMGGAMWLVGYDDPNTTPLVPQGNMSFHVAGQWATIGTMAALQVRSMTGVGQQVDVSIQEAVALVIDGYDSAPYEYQGELRRRRDFEGKVKSSDGKYLVLHMPNIAPDRWDAFRTWLKDEDENGGEEIRDVPANAVQANIAKLRSVGQRLADTRTADEMCRLGQSFGFTWTAANTADELMYDEQLNYREFFRPVHHPEFGTTYLYGGPTAEWSEGAWSIRRRPPLLGEDNAKWEVPGS